MINFTVNDRGVSGEDGWTILELAREYAIDIPTLWHHGAVEPSLACRLCIVGVRDGRRSREVGSCVYPIREGVKVATERVWVSGVLASGAGEPAALRNRA